MWSFNDSLSGFGLGSSTGLRADPLDEAVRGAEDTPAGGRHDSCWILTCPSSDIRKGVLTCFNADVSTDKVGDRFGLHLGHAAAVPGRAVFPTRVMEPEVAELVGKCLQCLGVIEVVADADYAMGKVGVAVGAMHLWDVSQTSGEPCPSDRHRGCCTDRRPEVRGRYLPTFKPLNLAFGRAGLEL